MAPLVLHLCCVLLISLHPRSIALAHTTECAPSSCSPHGPTMAPPPPKPPTPKPPSPPACPTPPNDGFVNDKQRKAYKVIQRFKRTITDDPFGITNTWVGPLVCNYKGFACESPPNSPDTPTIAAVDFNGYQLAAPTVKGFLDDLPDLAFFHANTNNFTDTVPNLYKLIFIYELDFSNNKLCGPFPTSVANIKQLTFLDLRYNSFSSYVQPSVFDLKLQVLFLNNNGFSGVITYDFGSTTAKYVTLANNDLTGPIPRSIGQAKDTLLEISLLNNKLSGCLPYEIGFLYKAIVFDASSNFLSGEIPYSFACLEKVEQLILSDNRLFGEVPDVVCKLPNLLNFSLSDNYFTSLGPYCEKLVESGVLDVSGNCIPGFKHQRKSSECESFSCSTESCPVTPNLHIIPCNKPWCGGGTYTPPPQPRRRAMSLNPSPTYTALNRPQS